MLYVEFMSRWRLVQTWNACIKPTTWETTAALQLRKSRRNEMPASLYHDLKKRTKHYIISDFQSGSAITAE